MPQQVTITISYDTDIKPRFLNVTYKRGIASDGTVGKRQVYGMQADTDGSDYDMSIVYPSYERWLYEAIRMEREYMEGEPVTGLKGETTVTLLMPGNWEHYAPNAPGLRYAMLQLILNGMLSDWYEITQPESAAMYRKNAELNKAEITSIIYSLRAPGLQQHDMPSEEPSGEAGGGGDDELHRSEDAGDGGEQEEGGDDVNG